MAEQELDLIAYRKKKKRNKRLRKLNAVLVIIAALVTIYFTRDKWIPFFDGIVTRVMITSKNDGVLAGGNFPLTISGGTDYEIGNIGNDFILLNDTHFYIYDVNAKLISDKQHMYNNPQMDYTKKRALIYDAGGYGYRVETKTKTVFDKKSSEIIILGKIAENGNFAIVTKADDFPSIMTIYDSKGEFLYRYKSLERIVDVNFYESGKSCIATTIDANEGQMVSTLHKFTFSKSEEVFTSEKDYNLSLSTQIRSDGNIVSIGDKKASFFNSKGEYLSSYNYKHSLIGFSSSDKLTVLLFKNDINRTTSISIIDEISKEPSEIIVPNNAKKVFADNKFVYVLTDTSVTAYTSLGTATVSVPVSDEYIDFYRVSDFIFLLGFTDVNRITFVND